MLGDLFGATGASTGLDLFSGTTRVAQEFKRRGAEVWAVDSAAYSRIFAECYVATDAGKVDRAEIEGNVAEVCHFAVTSLVQDLARLRVRLWIAGGRLRRRERSQNALGEGRIDP